MRIDRSWSSRARAQLSRAQLADDEAEAVDRFEVLTDGTVRHQQQTALGRGDRASRSSSRWRSMRIPPPSSVDPILPWIWLECVPVITLQLCICLALALAATFTLVATVGKYTPVTPAQPVPPSSVRDLSTWRCSRPPAAARGLPAFLVYALPTSPSHALGPLPVFQHLLDQDVGDIYVVTEGSRRFAPPLAGAVGKRRCAVVQRTRAPDFPSARLLSLEQRALAALLKLDLLNHLPHRVANVSGASLEPPRRVVVLDSDAICLPGSPHLLQKQFQLLRPPRQFLFAGRSGWRPSVNRSTGLSARSGIFSGALGIDLAGFRAFDAERRRSSHATSSRPSTLRDSWWHDGATAHKQPLALLPSKDGARSRAVWSMMVDAFPEVWNALPCGLHAEGHVLQGIALHGVQCIKAFHGTAFFKQ